MPRVEAKLMKESQEVTPAKSYPMACGEQVQMVTPTEVAQILSTTTRDIYRRIEAGEVHSIEAPDGEVFICAPSARV